MIDCIRFLKIFLVLGIFYTIEALGEANLIEVSENSFIEENPTKERKAIVNFIVDQFNDKQENGVTQEELDKIWNNELLRNKLQMLRFQIVNQELYTDSFKIINDYYYKPLKEYFLYLTKKYKINDVDFIVHAKDEINEKDYDNSIPLPPTFIMSKNLQNKHEKDRFLIPDSHMVDVGRDWFGLSKKIEDASKDILWQQKINKIFWRGGATGSRDIYKYNITNFDKLARIKLVMFSKLYPDLIDAEITAYYEFSEDQGGKNLKKILNTLFNNKEKRVNEIDHLKYKYLIAIDGNTCPWLRVPWIMLSNSVLVKQETSTIEWFYPAMKVYEHYVPVREDLTDIFKQIEWMKQNDAKLEDISTNAQRLVKENLMPEHIEKQMVIILNRYSYIQKNSKIKATLPKLSF